MLRLRTRFICEACGHIHSKAWGWCQSCGARGSLHEDVEEAVGIPEELGPIEEKPRLSSGCAEFDEVCGGGLVAGSVALLAGEPGIGKSTLLSQICSGLQGKEAIYFSGEENTAQINRRVKRLGLNSFKILATGMMEQVIKTINTRRPALAVIDSIQTLRSQDSMGSIEQIRGAVMELVQCAKKTDCAMILVGHVTKSGSIAGPKLLEHMVDLVLSFEKLEVSEDIRALRSSKNRFGSTEEIGLFKMTEQGLEVVPDPSAYLCSFRSSPTVGSIIFPSKEGSRPLLVEIQALVVNSHLQMPRRYMAGWCYNRFSMILAKLEAHAKISFAAKDVYLDIVGGVRIMDAATADLAAAIAIWSSAKNIPIPPQVCAFGEITLSGEIRPAKQAQERAKLAQKYGVDQIISCENIPNVKALEKMMQDF